MPSTQTVAVVLFYTCASLLVACGGTDNNIENDLNIDRSNSGFIAHFSPADSIIPFPSNLLFTGSLDGTLNIPVTDANDYSDPQVALNVADGFSTLAPISTTFNLAIDPTSLSAQTVRVFEVTVTGAARAVTGITRELTYGTDYVASLSSVDDSGKTLVISPLRPLTAKSHYLVALTTGIRSSTGRTVAAEATYLITKRTTALIADGVSQVATLNNTQATSLEPLRQLVNAQETVLAGAGLHSDTIVLSWTFSTLSVGDVLTQVRNITSANSTINPNSIGTTHDFLGTGPDIADIYAGTLSLPYYLSNASTTTDPLNKFWRGAGNSLVSQFNPTPVATSTETVPLLVAIPNTVTMPSSGWPVVMFQHGITSDRSAMLAIADALASQGFATVAIDMPLHGLPSSHPLYMNGLERTFDLDLINNTTSAPGSDGNIDTSGSHFINLRNLVVTRDNVRQSAADLFSLFNALSTMDYDGGGADFDTANVYFLGHSLGAMVGAPFLALEPGVKAAVLGMPGSGIAKLLDGSASFGPVIAAGLAGAGVVKGSADYEGFMMAAQTLMDAGDPANYASATAANRGILLYEIIGNGGSNLPDQVIPNNVMAAAPVGTVRAPLSGTDPYAALLGLTQISTTTSSATAQKSWLRFTSGDHRSLLDPTASALTTSVMQTATAAFLASNGLDVSITDNSVVE